MTDRPRRRSAGPTSRRPGDGPLADVRGQRAGRPRPRPALRRRRRAHPRLQHGLPQRPPRGHRRLRPAVPRGRRRRRRLLAAAGRRAGRSASAPPAMVWHHRRNSVRAYLRQQMRLRRRRGDAGAQVAGEVQRRRARLVVGPALRQGTHAGARPHRRADLPRHLGQRALPVRLPRRSAAAWRACRSCPSGTCSWSRWRWTGLARHALASALLAAPLCALTAGASVAQAVISGARASFTEPRSRMQTLGLHGLTALLHLLQPLARLRGRLRSALTPWRRHGPGGFAWPRSRHLADVDRELGGARRSAGAAGGTARRRRLPGQPRRRLRRLGPRGPRRRLECGAHRAGGRGARPGPADGAVPRPAALSSPPSASRWPCWPVGRSLGSLDGALTAAIVLGTTGLAHAAAAVSECGAAMATAREALDVEAR